MEECDRMPQALSSAADLWVDVGGLLNYDHHCRDGQALALLQFDKVALGVVGGRLVARGPCAPLLLAGEGWFTASCCVRFAPTRYLTG